MLTHDQIYECLYPIWQNLPGSNAKVKLGGLLADLEAETLEAEPVLAVGFTTEDAAQCLQKYGQFTIWSKPIDKVRVPVTITRKSDAA